MKNLIGILVAGMAMSSVAANTWWVDDDNFGKGGLDGKSAKTAYGTIQDALNDAKFEEGDTVKVLPGVYDQGGAYLETAGVTNRVLITKKCTIISTDGKSVTHIVGKKDTSNAYGLGSAAVRCVSSFLPVRATVTPL